MPIVTRARSFDFKSNLLTAQFRILLKSVIKASLLKELNKLGGEIWASKKSAVCWKPLVNWFRLGLGCFRKILSFFKNSNPSWGQELVLSLSGIVLFLTRQTVTLFTAFFKAWKMRISRKIKFFYWMFRLKKYLQTVYAKFILSDRNYQHIDHHPHLHHCQQLDVPQVCWFPRRPPSPLESDYRFSYLRFYHLRTIHHTLQCTALNPKNFCVHSYRAELQHSSSFAANPLRIFPKLLTLNSCGSTRPFTHGKVRLYPWEVCVLCVTSIPTVKLPMGNHYGYIKKNKRITHDVSQSKS